MSGIKLVSTGGGSITLTAPDINTDEIVEFPASDVVTIDSSQTLTNKTISGSNNTISNVSLNTAVTGTLPVANGGTGATTLSGVLIGNGTSAFSTKANPSGAFVGTTDTQTLTNKTINGSNNTITNISLTTAVTGTLQVTNGGTGATTAANARTNLGAQATLVSGTNIKTVGGESLLGSGNITITTNMVSGAVLFTSSGTFTVPVGVTSVLVTVIGAAGGGRDGSTTQPGNGGGAMAQINNLSPGSEITVTVGLGGFRVGNVSGGVGGTGGTSSFGSYVTATGGTGAGGSTNGVAGSGTIPVDSNVQALRTAITILDLKYLANGTANNLSTRRVFDPRLSFGAGRAGAQVAGMDGCVLVEY